ncbi:MAG TPA: hypothetical protein VMW57_09815 [Methyloceanibacter sp.]|nr:hypothetical protein [Methyloceanibacter sp.]
MLIVGAGLMATAVTVFLLWNAVHKCRELWRARKRPRRVAHRERETHDS